MDETMKKRRGATCTMNVSEEEVTWFTWLLSSTTFFPYCMGVFIPYPGLPCVSVCVFLHMCYSKEMWQYQSFTQPYYTKLVFVCQTTCQRLKNHTYRNWFKKSSQSKAYKKCKCIIFDCKTHPHTHTPTSGLEMKKFVVNSLQLIFAFF